jgi:hypothetical protein
MDGMAAQFQSMDNASEGGEEQIAAMVRQMMAANPS